MIRVMAFVFAERSSVYMGPSQSIYRLTVTLN